MTTDTFKPTRSQRDCLVAMLTGKRDAFFNEWEVWHPLDNAGMVVRAGASGWELTAAGLAAAREEHAKREKARLRRNAAARGRADAMRSIGMVRTRAGGWE